MFIEPLHLESPDGPLYVRPGDVVALDGVTQFCGSGRNVRRLYLKGLVGPPLLVFDTSENMKAIIDALTAEFH